MKAQDLIIILLQEAIVEVRILLQEVAVAVHIVAVVVVVVVDQLVAVDQHALIQHVADNLTRKTI